MVSPEFKATVSEKNLLRTRIMLKDSFVIDPTFLQLDEMLSYAKRYLPDLMVPYDGDFLEDDSSKWTLETMNEELVQVVTNFSEVRISHLKKVVTKVLAKEIEKVRSFDSKEARRKEALKKLNNEAKRISKALCEVEKKKTWRMNNIDEMEQAAKEIIKAVHDYKTNR